jgi:hypothetical protein
MSASTAAATYIFTALTCTGTLASIQGRGWRGETQRIINFGGKLKFHPVFPFS